MSDLKPYNPISMPLRTIPPNQLDMHVLDVLGAIQRLLSIQVSAKNDANLPVLFNMIKDAAWSKSPKQIIEAFTLYVKCKLSLNGKMLEPISGHLDAIVFGKVMQAYTDQLPKPKPLKIEQPKKTDKEKEDILAQGALRLFNEYKELGMVFPGNSHIYDYLNEKGFIKPSKQFWKENELQAKINLRRSKTPLADSQIKKIVVPKSTETEIMSETKRIILEKYFESKL